MNTFATGFDEELSAKCTITKARQSCGIGSCRAQVSSNEDTLSIAQHLNQVPPHTLLSLIHLIFANLSPTNSMRFSFSGTQWNIICHPFTMCDW